MIEKKVLNNFIKILNVAEKNDAAKILAKIMSKSTSRVVIYFEIKW